MEYDRYVCAAALGKVFGARCREARSLVDAFGGVVELFRAGRGALKGLTPRLASLSDELFAGSTLEWAAREVEWCRSHGIKPLYIGDPDYPQRLRECPDAPVIIYTLGKADLAAPRMLAIVGTRRSTWCGRKVCGNIVASLEAICGRVTVVSGLAFGIDAAAHTASLEASLPTVAVVPSGLDAIYPSSHRDLARRIVESGGALVTDYPRGGVFLPTQFLRRNRIIAGLCDGVLLAESFVKGGGLITTSLANSYGREVMAVPGRTTDPSFEGCNNLIASDGAHLVTCAVDVARTMGWEIARRRRAAMPRLEFPETEKDPCRSAVLAFLREKGASDYDSMVAALCARGDSLTPSEISSAITSLELDGKIVNPAGRMYELR